MLGVPNLTSIRSDDNLFSHPTTFFLFYVHDRGGVGLLCEPLQYIEETRKRVRVPLLLLQVRGTCWGCVLVCVGSLRLSRREGD